MEKPKSYCLFVVVVVVVVGAVFYTVAILVVPY